MSEPVIRRRFPFRLSHFFEQTDRAGVGSVPLIGLVSCFLGLTMALLTGYQLHNYGQQGLVPTLVAIGFNRELGPLMTGIMVAARVGAAFTAELGTMKVAEEVEAIEAMGVGPLRYLVAPRIAAVFFIMPCHPGCLTTAQRDRCKPRASNRYDQAPAMAADLADDEKIWRRKTEAHREGGPVKAEIKTAWAVQRKVTFSRRPLLTTLADSPRSA